MASRLRSSLLLVGTAVIAVAHAGSTLAADAPADSRGRPAVGATPSCRCDRFDDELEHAEALFASRGEGVTLPLDGGASARFRARVDAAYAAAHCLTGCDGAPDPARNRARILLAEAGFKTAGLSKGVAHERLTAGLEASERCLAVEPGNPACRLWHASTRGILARDSWNPLNVRLPHQLLDEFRAARGGAAPGRDLLDGAATRGEASLLLRAPGAVGGDVPAARRLMEEAATAPRFTCVVANRILWAESLARTSAAERAIAELRATVDAGLPSCGSNRYENALEVGDAERCLRRLEADSAADPGWSDDCR